MRVILGLCLCYIRVVVGLYYDYIGLYWSTIMKLINTPRAMVDIKILQDLKCLIPLR